MPWLGLGGGWSSSLHNDPTRALFWSPESSSKSDHRPPSPGASTRGNSHHPHRSAPPLHVKNCSQPTALHPTPRPDATHRSGEKRDESTDVHQSDEENDGPIPRKHRYLGRRFIEYYGGGGKGGGCGGEGLEIRQYSPCLACKK